MKITKQQLKEIIKEELLKEMSKPEHYVAGMDSRKGIPGMKSPTGPPGGHISPFHELVAKLTEIDPKASEQLKLAAEKKEAADAELDQKLHDLTLRLEKLKER